MSITSFKEKCGKLFKHEMQTIYYVSSRYMVALFSYFMCKKNSLYFETTEISVTLGGCLINWLWGNI